MIRDFIARRRPGVARRSSPCKEDVAQLGATRPRTPTGIQASRSERAGPLLEPPARLPGRARARRWPSSSATADAQIPTLRKLRRGRPGAGALPALRRAVRARVARARSTTWAAPPTPGSPPCASRARRSPSCAELSASAPRLGKPLRQFLQTIDDRRRSTDERPAGRAAARRPRPTRPPTRRARASPAWRRFWNYVYCQTLGINAFDEFGHLLRIVAFTGGPCSPLRGATPPKQQIERVRLLARPDTARRARPARPDRDAPRRPSSSARQHREARRRAERRPPPRRGRAARHRAAAGPARHLQARRSCCPRTSRSCSTGCGKPRPTPGCPRRARPAPEQVPDRAPRLPAGRHETPRPTASISRQPRAGGRGDGARGAASPCCSPYKANSGLPFVPTYDVRAEIPGGSNLVVGNEVRIGGFRVGRGRPDPARPCSEARRRRRADRRSSST